MLQKCCKKFQQQCTHEVNTKKLIGARNLGRGSKFCEGNLTKFALAYLTGDYAKWVNEFLKGKSVHKLWFMPHWLLLAYQKQQQQLKNRFRVFISTLELKYFNILIHKPYYELTKFSQVTVKRTQWINVQAVYSTSVLLLKYCRYNN